MLQNNKTTTTRAKKDLFGAMRNPKSKLYSAAFASDCGDKKKDDKEKEKTNPAKDDKEKEKEKTTPAEDDKEKDKDGEKGGTKRKLETTGSPSLSDKLAKMLEQAKQAKT